MGVVIVMTACSEVYKLSFNITNKLCYICEEIIRISNLLAHTVC